MKADYFALLKREKGREPPPEFTNPPRIPSHLMFYADSFWRLHNDRPIGMSLGPIPFVAIDAYARRYRLRGEAFERFFSLIRIQDSEYLTLKSRKSSDDGTVQEVEATDASGVKSILSRLAERQKDDDDNRLE